MTANDNVIALARGYRYRLELCLGVGGHPCGHEFAMTMDEAKTRKRQLRAAGYSATVCRIMNFGRLVELGDN